MNADYRDKSREFRGYSLTPGVSRANDSSDIWDPKQRWGQKTQARSRNHEPANKKIGGLLKYYSGFTRLDKVK